MRVFCNGFNLYGQVTPTKTSQLESFEEIVDDEKLQNFELNHTYSIVHSNNIIRIYGCGNLIAQSLDIVNDIKCITSNDDRILILRRNNDLLQISLNDIKEIVKLPLFVSNDEEILKISAGAKITVCYTDRGTVYNLPNKLNFESCDIVDVKTGREHCILLDGLGNVYTFGCGSRGQLGHGRLDDETEPILVEALAGIKIIDVAAGGWHSCAVSNEGDLYTWGWNPNGQLGHCTFTVMASPQVVDFPSNNLNVIKAAAGNRHTIVLLDGNVVYGCGWNKYKQLNSSEDEKFSRFVQLQNFDGEICDVKCGPWNSVVICK